ncbi:hypothetical protein QR680_012513 [Steinernema hermaphroditum]|uniref:Uncharacterized protein n=1 Tax=Steinernema hermaphroditum TaxID=289476 RepID=A0AA39M0V6_9BILA|nr:hypothetical protein QR680_012513 [Steinernema hermaphroditum]
MELGAEIEIRSETKKNKKKEKKEEKKEEKRGSASCCTFVDQAQKNQPILLLTPRRHANVKAFQRVCVELNCDFYIIRKYIQTYQCKPIQSGRVFHS